MEHFTIEAVAGGCTRACCKLCKQTFAYSSGSKIAGTSHLKRHIALGSCPKIKNQEKKMLALTSGRQLRISIYQKEKQSLMQVFGTMPGRVSLTIGLWTTSQTLGYVCLTGQFIDSDWRLHRRMLNFMMVSSPHSENALSEAIGVSLSDWSMKSKLFTITLDNNCSSHDIYSANLRDHLSNKNTLMLKGQLFVVRCYAHILNVVAQDVIASIHGIIYNIRESVKFIKASPAREENFAEIALQLEIPSTKTLSLDAGGRLGI
ncbi:zinc finger BED domain-containing protein RICESLEEPER 2-like [Phoenix dactylifera]|uniref:Zinc finger BED domain-containing protein RICESLEEPER 2-like n=1 Tax=Phoenix dactylifera TaxID=42345 RepID=A0A8B8ZV12_PHODC|nr:zinc finger BED domain-containing protein RICESLEEPER 2-like [Phoenix dactylifera]